MCATKARPKPLSGRRWANRLLERRARRDRAARAAKVRMARCRARVASTASTQKLASALVSEVAISVAPRSLRGPAGPSASIGGACVPSQPSTWYATWPRVGAPPPSWELGPRLDPQARAEGGARFAVRGQGLPLPPLGLPSLGLRPPLAPPRSPTRAGREGARSNSSSSPPRTGEKRSGPVVVDSGASHPWWKVSGRWSIVEYKIRLGFGFGSGRCSRPLPPRALPGAAASRGPNPRVRCRAAARPPLTPRPRR